MGLSTPLYLGKSILADFGAYEFRCLLVFLARFPAVESSPEFLLCMSSIDAANFVVCSIEAYIDFANFFVCFDKDFMKSSNIFCKLAICCSMRSSLGSAIGKEFGFDMKCYKPWVELTIENRLTREECQRAYIHMVKIRLYQYGTLGS
jgi:hypothetical protein